MGNTQISDRSTASVALCSDVEKSATCQNHSRIAWIDVAKGICMISVIAGHLGVSVINSIVFAYHLTVFFLLSGYTLKQVDLTKDYLNKKFRTLMIPYFVTCFCIMVMDVFNEIWWNSTSIESITGLLAKDLIRAFLASGSIKTIGSIEVSSRIGAIWFLPALFFALLFTQYILKRISDKRKRFTTGFILMIFSLISSRFIWLPFSIQSAMFAVPFVLAGYELRQCDLLSKLSWKNCAIFFIVFLLCLNIQMTKISFVNATMDDILGSLVAGFCSSAIVIFCSRKLERCKVLAWIGRNSLIFLCIHLFEMETMGTWFRLFLELFSVPYNAFSRFCIKIVFISISTAVILFLMHKVHFKTAKQLKTVTFVRDASIDISKGFLIVLMLVGHFSVESTFRSIIHSFHMVAFVFWSGYFFRPNDAHNLPKSICNLAKSLLIPYALFGILAVFLVGTKSAKTVLFGMSFSKNLLTAVPSVGPVYFILMLFLVRVLYLFVERFTPPQRKYYKFIVCLAISLLGVSLGKSGYWLPWSLDCAMYSIIFYHLGYCFRESGALTYFKEHLITYFALSIVWAYMIYSGSMELAIRNYGIYGMVILGATSATILLYMFSCYIYDHFPVWITRLMQWAGQSTLYILIIHALFNSKLSDFVGLELSKGYIYHMVGTVLLQIIIGMVICKFVQKIRIYKL